MEAARAATSSDLAAIEDLAAELYAELADMRGGELWTQREARPAAGPETFAALIASSDIGVFVGTIAEVVVGFATVEVARLHDGRNLGVIRELIVTAEAREVGVGEAVLEAVLRWCRERDCMGVDAFALPGHRSTKNFFEGAHFTARGLVMHHSLRP